MNTEANKKLVQQIFADSANRSGTTFIDHLAEDATWVQTGQCSWSRTFTGKDEITNGLFGYLRSLLTDRPRSLAFNFIAEGEYVVVEARGDNLTRSGERYDNEYCFVWRVQNGRITQIKEYCDSALVERVLGSYPKAAA
ncbi:MAG: nuclear transport factor 2 family protein [Afipia sp.]